MKTIILLSALLVNCMTGFTQTKNARQELNGKTYTITFTQTKGKTGQRKWQWDRDELIFKNHSLFSTCMNKHESFPAAAYSSTVDSSSGQKTIHFKFESSRGSDKKIEIEGIVNNNNVSGTATWISPVGTYYYTFSGVLKS